MFTVRKYLGSWVAAFGMFLMPKVMRERMEHAIDMERLRGTARRPRRGPDTWVKSTARGVVVHHRGGSKVEVPYP